MSVRSAAGWRAAVRPVAEDILRAHDVPGLIVVVVQGEAEPEYLVTGTDAEGHALSTDSLLPVASITKVAAALAVLRLAADGMLALDDRIDSYLPDAASAGQGITIRALLSHTSGISPDLAADTAPYRPDLTWPKLAQACLKTPPADPPRTRVRYSNLGSGLAAVIVERLTHQPFNAALKRLVLDPLQVEGYLGDEPPRRVSRITGDLGEHAGTAIEPFNTAFWRSLAMPWGGMVATPAGALGIIRALSGVPSGFLPPGLRAEATRNQTGVLGGGFFEPMLWTRCAWGIGAELRGDKDPHWTPAGASAGSFGHAGSSGCLAWCDPSAGVSWAILGPRTFQDWYARWPEIGAAILSSVA